MNAKPVKKHFKEDIKGELRILGQHNVFLENLQSKWSTILVEKKCGFNVVLYLTIDSFYGYYMYF